MYTRTFFRAHGLGNDYLVWEGDPAEVDDHWVRRVCDRHTGVGSDGVLVPVEPAPGAEAGVRIFNPDGSEAEKSGNGVRIFALWFARQDGLMAFTVSTPGGFVRVSIHDRSGADQVRAEMGVARLAAVEVICDTPTHPVDIGNPHRVVLGIPDDWKTLGERIEGAVFGRTNVQFVQVLSRGRARARIWERGACHTLASGSSASAVARVVTALGLCDSPLIIEMEGGELLTEVDADGAVTIDGTISAIGRIELDPGW